MSTPPEEGPEDVFVLDTSSLIQIRRLMSQESKARLTMVYDAVTKLAQRGVIAFPQAVIDEIKHGAPAISGTADHPLAWATASEEHAVPNHELFTHVRAVLAEVPDLLDRDKPSTADEADPYVVALALKLREDSARVTVVTEERNDSPDKTSMGSACGILGLPAISMRVFLARQGIWKGG